MSDLPALIETDQRSFTRFMNQYSFALKEIATRIDILKLDFEATHEYSPIEHVAQRLKSPQSIIRKAHERGCSRDLTAIRENIQDIAGIRITCSFVSDIYRVAGMLMQQEGIEVIEYKDYIEAPKPSGYRSLHMIIEIPVHLSDRVERVYVEVQIRTIAMDFWASLEHKIYYKHQKEVPQRLKDELHEAATDIERLDHKMERIHKEIRELKIANED